MLRIALVAVIAAGGALAPACAARSGDQDSGYLPPEDDGDGEDGSDGDDSAPPPSASICDVDTDCVPASSTCCGCPTFAVPADAGWGDACDAVPCDPPTGCPAVEAVCDDGRCQLTCVAVACELLCDGGFAVDAAGCLTCACAAPRGPRCDDAADCVLVPADCCGCRRGGADTAVPVDSVDDHQAGLGCRGDEVCPGVDVCHADAVAACRSGACVMLTGPTDGPGAGLPEGACGRPDRPRCPAGQRCVLNTSDTAGATAAALGLGVCAPPT